MDRLIVANRQVYGSRSGELLRPEALEAAQSLFGRRILERRLSRRWPGTHSTAQDCLVLIVEFDAALIEPMATRGPDLFDWTGWPAPSLPEDLCLYRHGDAWPVLVSVTHERDAWILSDGRIPIVGARRSRFGADELMIPSESPDFVG